LYLRWGLVIMAFEPLEYSKFTDLKSTQAANLEAELIEVKKSRL
jgi:hypothetical protein